MKRHFLLGASFLAITPALGLVRGALAAAPGPSNWNGGYVGGVAGYGSGQSGQSDSGIPAGGSSGGLSGSGSGAPSGDGRYSVNGGILGGSLGYNWQRGALVFGADGDYSLTNIGGSSAACGATSSMPHACGTNLDSFGTLRGRFGYAFGATGNWMLYGTGGLAFGQIHAWDNLTPAAGDEFRAGWTIGGGVEAALSRSWSAKIELLYLDFGKAQYFNIVPGVPETVSLTASVVRAGLVYHLGGPFIRNKRRARPRALSLTRNLLVRLPTL